MRARAVRAWLRRLPGLPDHLRLLARFPELRGVAGQMKGLATEMREDYRRYVTEVSKPDMAVSLETAAFLRAFCRLVGPRSILDLGSGFSSFTLRSHAAETNGVTVCTVDDDDVWLARTTAFLDARGLSTDAMMTWATFRQRAPARFDLIVHDLDGMDLRREALPFILGLASARGVVVLDDVHMPEYASAVRAVLRPKRHRHFSLLRLTRDYYGRHASIVTDLDAG